MLLNRPNFKEESKRLDTMTKSEIKNFILKNKDCFLDEYFLRFYIKYIYYNDELLFNKKFKEYNIYPDILVKNKKIIFEYDGPTHYTTNETIIKDYDKDYLFREKGYKIIRIPFFIEFNEKIIKKYFGEKYIDISSTYKNGFIHPNVVLPTSFCERGLYRFIDYIENIEDDIKTDIFNSLWQKSIRKKSLLFVISPIMFLKYADKIKEFITKIGNEKIKNELEKDYDKLCFELKYVNKYTMI